MKQRKFSLLAMAVLAFIPTCSDDDWEQAPSSGGVKVDKWNQQACPELFGFIGKRFEGTNPRPLPGTDGKYVRYYIFTNEGKMLTVFASKVLDEKLSVFNPGDYLRIQFLGKPPGKTYFMYDVAKSKKVGSCNPEWEVAQIIAMKNAQAEQAAAPPATKPVYSPNQIATPSAPAGAPAAPSAPAAPAAPSAPSAPPIPGSAPSFTAPPSVPGAVEDDLPF